MTCEPPLQSLAQSGKDPVARRIQANTSECSLQLAIADCLTYTDTSLHNKGYLSINGSIASLLQLTDSPFPLAKFYHHGQASGIWQKYYVRTDIPKRPNRAHYLLIRNSSSVTPFAARTQQYFKEQIGTADDKVRPVSYASTRQLRACLPRVES